MRLEVVDGRPAEIIVADASDERHRSPETRRHHGLVRTLAAEALFGAVGDERLAFLGDPLAVGDLVDHHRADDHDRSDLRGSGQAQP